ncbi:MULTISPECIES: trans-aconitate 2-methyltransferase [Pseudomonas]|uniref:trans-aconitate 2-methyltransferase n=1 Tax=Pseudomonas TaxID=286 RepID=UPI0006D48C08|nr:MULTISPECIES: trans-aconitate 2-methyltransferase [Pseudomonas]KAB5625872.1 trans-aconitate 2-methyltransferase [Pseudomonas putida]OCT29538.1 trans-aconitate 2-methyltransferase [Pseudomonas putida]OCT31234.1 trans-aconitate 2-methyltransferase [Pseudomonas putida]OCT33476.1 trans-aconitate 2-methyltransferase [Pseudomonas putida]OCT39922.1 trans-aconitate 2-methyltransferase [Pseudomonas putida]
MAWSATQYSLFENERTRAVRDLLAAVPPRPVRHATDLGCGPGNSTEVLLQQHGDAQVLALDSDQDMIDKARERPRLKVPRVRCEVADIATWKAAEPQDLILANASLQWVPNHRELYPHLIRQLSEGGSLAVQTPDNLDEPAHKRMREIASQGPWKDKFSDFSLPPRHSGAFYYDLLSPLCERVDVWRTTYHHVLEGGASAVVEWFKGSGLRPYLARLDEAERESFLQLYLQAMEQDYPKATDGKVLLPFPRLFVVATR